MKSKKKSLSDLTGLIAHLRSPFGCPWDRKQTHRSILPNLIEETYEVVEAIEQNDSEKLKEELGDLLLQVVFHSQMASERKRFDMEDVITGVYHKIVLRHPHVFKKKAKLSVDKVLSNWEQMKQKHKKGRNDSTFSGLPRHLPALVKAVRVQEKSARMGFVWQNPKEIVRKIKEELGELEAELNGGRKNRVDTELADLFLALVSLAWYYKKDPETIVRDGVEKFIRRFSKMEKLARRRGHGISDLTGAQLRSLWEMSK